MRVFDWDSFTLTLFGTDHTPPDIRINANGPRQWSRRFCHNSQILSWHVFSKKKYQSTICVTEKDNWCLSDIPKMHQDKIAANMMILT